MTQNQNSTLFSEFFISIHLVRRVVDKKTYQHDLDVREICLSPQLHNLK